MTEMGTQAEWMTSAPERCGHCDRPIWVDEEHELFVDRNRDADCPDAPRVENPGGAVLGTWMGTHTP